MSVWSEVKNENSTDVNQWVNDFLELLSIRENGAIELSVSFADAYAECRQGDKRT